MDATVIEVRYGLSVTARKALCVALGSLSSDDMPPLPNFPNVHVLPLPGDILCWEAVDARVQLCVRHRLYKFSEDGLSMRIDLMLDVPK